MPLMLDVSEEVRAEIGDAEADRLIAGENAPGTYDCTSCRTPGDTTRERTSTVLFVGEETAVLAFAHADCVPSQVVTVPEDQIVGAVQNITQPGASGAVAQAPVPAAAPQAPRASQVPQAAPQPAQAPPVPPEHGVPEPAVLGITCGLVLCQGVGRPALVVEPTGPIARPGRVGGGDEFLPLLVEQGFMPVRDVEQPPAELPGWSVLLARGELHAVLQPGVGGRQNAWWQAHQPLPVSEPWRNAVNRQGRVLVYAAPAGVIGHQPREDLMREAMESAASRGLLLGATLPLAGT